MFLSTQVSRFGNLLSPAKQAVDPRNLLMPLQHVLVQTTDKGTTVVGSAGDFEIHQFSKEVSGEEAEFTLPAGKADAIFRVLDSNADIAIENNKSGSMVCIKTPTGQFSLATLPADSYEKIQAGKFDHELVIPADSLSRALSKISHAMAFNDVRSFLCGVCLDAGEDAVNFVATDGHRLCMYKFALPGVDKFRVIIPNKFVQLLISRLSGASSNVIVSLNDGFMQFRFDNITLVTKLLSGKFPPYLDVIPERIGSGAEVNRADVMAATKAVLITASEVSKSVRIAIKDGEITLSTDSSKNPDDTGSDVIEYKGDVDSVSVGVHGGYLLDALGVSESPNVALYCTSDTSPIHVEDLATPELTLIIMPCRL